MVERNIQFKAAVIGCGNIGTEVKNFSKKIQPATHAGAYHWHKKTRLVALVDTDKGKLLRAKRIFPNATLYSNTKEMLKDERLDIVSIATPTKTHHNLVLLTASHNIPVIVCEKPIARNIVEAEKMIVTCKKNKSQLIINHQRRFDILLNKWAEKIKKGLLGNLYQGNAYYYNGFMNNGTHLVDVLKMFFGKPLFVSAGFNTQTTSNLQDPNVDGFIIFKNGARATFQSLSRNYGHFEIALFGEKGALRIKNLGFEIEYRKKIKNKDFKGFFALSTRTIQEGHERSFFKEMVNHVVAYLEGRVQPRSTGEDGLSVLKTLTNLKKSAQKNGLIIRM